MARYYNQNNQQVSANSQKYPYSNNNSQLISRSQQQSNSNNQFMNRTNLNYPLNNSGQQYQPKSSIINPSLQLGVSNLAYSQQHMNINTVKPQLVPNYQLVSNNVSQFSMNTYPNRNIQITPQNPHMNSSPLISKNNTNIPTPNNSNRIGNVMTPNTPQIYGGINTKKNNKRPSSYCSSCSKWITDNYEIHLKSEEHLMKNRTKNNYDYNQKRIKKNKKIRTQTNNQQNNSQANDQRVIKSTERVSLSNSNSPKETSFEDCKQTSPVKSEDNQTDSSAFLIPVSGVYCILCEVFFEKSAEKEIEHCGTTQHRENYEKFRSSDNNEDNVTRKFNVDLKTDDIKPVKLDTSLKSNSELPVNKKLATAVVSSKQITAANTCNDDEQSISDFLCPEVSLDFPEDDIEDYVAKELTEDNF